MTLVSSGKISLGDIATEKGLALSHISLQSLSTTNINTNDTTAKVPANTSSLAYNRPDGIAPHRMSEFYAYNANATTTSTTTTLATTTTTTTLGPGTTTTTTTVPGTTTTTTTVPTTTTTTTTVPTTTTTSTTSTTTTTTTTTLCYSSSLAVSSANAVASGPPTICDGSTDTVFYISSGVAYYDTSCTNVASPGAYPTSTPGFYVNVQFGGAISSQIAC